MSVSLQPTTIDVLKALQQQDGVEANVLAKQLNLDYIVVMAAINELASLGLGAFKEEEATELILEPEGVEYAKKGLPESRVFDYMKTSHINEMELNALKEKV
nr:hypothetical protein [Candidatus Sigynarchaeota archaeon]